MDRQYEVQHLWNLSTTKKNGWQQDSCPVVRGDYGDLERAWTQATKAKAEHQRDDLMKEIEEGLKSQTTFRSQQKAAEQWIPQPVLIGKFIRAKRWMDEVVLEGKKEKPTITLGKCHKCERPVHGPNFKGCWEHLN